MMSFLKIVATCVAGASALRMIPQAHQRDVMIARRIHLLERQQEIQGYGGNLSRELRLESAGRKSPTTGS